MIPRSTPADTDPEAFEVLVECWRAMTIADRVALVDQITADVGLMARVGIGKAHPEMSDVEVRHELARRRFGAELADEAFQHLLV
jgi:hypothetical protein